MFDIGMTEMMVVAVVAILFIGPKELPGMLRTAGQIIRKVRGLAGDFQKQFDDALKEAELDGIKDSVDQVRKLDPTKEMRDRLNPLKAEIEEADASLKKAAESEPMVFDDSKAPTPAEPVKVDVEAALARQKKLDEAAAKPKPAAKPRAKTASKGKATAKPKATAAKAPAKTRGKPKAKAAAKAAT